MKLIGTIARVDIYNYLKNLVINSDDALAEGGDSVQIDNLIRDKSLDDIQVSIPDVNIGVCDVESSKAVSDHDLLRKLLSYDAKEDDSR